MKYKERSRRCLVWGSFFVFFVSLVPTGALGLCVKSWVANLRKGPGNQHPISWTVGKYTPLVEIQRKGNWIQVSDQDGQRHWVYRKMVTSKVRCLAVKVVSANLRTGPGSRHPLVSFSSAEKYTALQRLEREDDWHHVKDAFGRQFWIHHNLVWRPLRVSNVSF